MLDGNIECFTRHGWVKISEYVEGDEILQYNKYTDDATFTNPIDYIKQEHNNKYHFHNSRGLDQLVSSSQKMLIWKGYKKKGYNLEDFLPEELMNLYIDKKLDKGYYGIKTCFNIKNQPLDITDIEIRLAVMVSADGCIRNEYTDANKIEVHLKKQRKIDRIKELLNDANITYKIYDASDGTKYINFLVPSYINKDLTMFFNASYEQLKIIKDECLLWDGHVGYRSYFSSTKKSNCDVIQYAFISTNIRAGISIVQSQWKDCYVVTPTRNDIIGVTNVSHDTTIRNMYNFTVDDGYIIIRYNGLVSITGHSNYTTLSLTKI